MRSVPISATRVHLAVNRNPQTQYIHVLGLESCDSCDCHSSRPNTWMYWVWTLRLTGRKSAVDRTCDQRLTALCSIRGSPATNTRFTALHAVHRQRTRLPPNRTVDRDFPQILTHRDSPLCMTMDRSAILIDFLRKNGFSRTHTRHRKRRAARALA
jgi:hypothetical protein